GGGDLPLRMVLDGSGRLIVSGFSDLGDATLFRLTPSGDLDTTFSTDGKMLVDFGGSGDEGAGVAIDSSGRIVIGGTGGANADLVAARVLADGTLDTSFSGDGLAHADFGPGADEGEDLMIDANGKIVFGGTADADTAMAVARFNTDGTLDTGFDSDGKVRIDFAGGTTFENAEAMTLQADGKIVIAGRVGSDFAVARLHAETTGQNVRHYAVQDGNWNVTAVAASSDGTIVERFQYDPYGTATVLDANFAADADGASDTGWKHLHQGGRLDGDTGLYHFNIGGDGRDYSATLGRWMEADPIGYADGMSRYEYERSDPLGHVDPSGQSSRKDRLNKHQESQQSNRNANSDPNRGKARPNTNRHGESNAGKNAGKRAAQQAAQQAQRQRQAQKAARQKADRALRNSKNRGYVRIPTPAGIGYTGATAGSFTYAGTGTVGGGLAFGGLALAGGALAGYGLYEFNEWNGLNDYLFDDFDVPGGTMMESPIPGMGTDPTSINQSALEFYCGQGVQWACDQLRPKPCEESSRGNDFDDGTALA
ncbi:MAG: RHS repeat-associated core domain-containing protein, partial [Tepidisphaeraceae bacterium]